ncbi:hypothetical protein [Aureimonas jatrophae]|uniref:Tetratricopeptide repeat-containing protein n=1 Tax=Aureimonas jatrophae TaxID=1166073 RepID=A0A1H0ET59_9HYPH|nr:hypothetical protein [Aureimonas jatrophae]MBB3950327.1 hypothetical protein [Aureimonas jatrophae]SDN85545.1 hypothetical protein SAMN05192530_102208 [Aureimonas jatrophae]
MQQSYREAFLRLPPEPGAPAPAAEAASAQLLARADRLVETLDGADTVPVGGWLQARAAQTDGRAGEAAAILRALMEDPARAGEGALGLAVLALGRPDLEDAGAFARFCLDRGERTPRACAVAGLAALEAGNLADAQRLLSAAARIARTEEGASDDLRGAQRVLLLMQLGPR